MCELLGIESKQMQQWLCHKKITAMAEVVITPLKHEQVCSSSAPTRVCLCSNSSDTLPPPLFISLNCSEALHYSRGVKRLILAVLFVSAKQLYVRQFVFNHHLVDRTDLLFFPGLEHSDFLSDLQKHRWM